MRIVTCHKPDKQKKLRRRHCNTATELQRQCKHLKKSERANNINNQGKNILSTKTDKMTIRKNSFIC